MSLLIQRGSKNCFLLTNVSIKRNPGYNQYSKENTMTSISDAQKKRGWQRMRWLDGITDSIDMNLSKLREDGEGQESLACCSPWGRKESDRTEQLNNNNNTWMNFLANPVFMPSLMLLLCTKVHSGLAFLNSISPWPLALLGVEAGQNPWACNTDGINLGKEGKTK